MYARTKPLHPKANAKGLYPLHRVLMENQLGRLLCKGEEVHHKDEDKSNNAIENLELKTKSEHAKHHAKTVEKITVYCRNCGNPFELKPHQLRLRLRANKLGLACSRKCGGTRTMRDRGAASSPGS